MSENRSRVFRPVPVVDTPRMWFGILLVVVGVPIIYVLFTLLQTPVIRYQIENSTLVIQCQLGSSKQEKRIPLSRVSEARPELLRGGALRFGTEKPGYCVGLFAYPTLGEVSQMTDCSELAVLLMTSGEVAPIVLTPTDRDGFIKALWASRPATFAPPSRRTDSWWVTLITVVLVFVAAVLALVVTFFIAPTRLAYTVNDRTLEVTTLLSRRRLSLAGTTAHRHRPLLGARLSGVFLPGYLVGSALYDSMATSVLASVREDGVLLEGEGRLFLTPADPDAFLAALAAAGATIVNAEMLRRR